MLYTRIQVQEAIPGRARYFMHTEIMKHINEIELELVLRVEVARSANSMT